MAVILLDDGTTVDTTRIDRVAYCPLHSSKGYGPMGEATLTREAALLVIYIKGENTKELEGDEANLVRMKLKQYGIRVDLNLPHK
ncbi:MAG: hypothetical protein ACR2JB_31145 [Bryobacteraceae bacterium]